MTNFWPNLTFYLLVGLFCVLPVFVVAFKTIRAGLTRIRPQQPHPKRWAALTAIMATPLLCWAGIHAVLFYVYYYPHRSFDPSGWEVAPNKRYEMVDELQASRRLIGLDSTQVSALLGPAYHQDEASWSYNLGIRPGLGLSDGQVLVLEFSGDKVLRTRTYEN
ncbi:hypothetical protein [Hymenobacter lapidiphilus]|uniref:Outer membrane protein assembly factor BamE n=1 Tax=Hymenobacter lapidiphilus TaxID=2608003 RepID=A0A7Y7PMY8_9BACT|nr:hypothetical protein [Hymenobacter lapidiphilus]NVO30786.1 hypothetical protein [Hymenobacter lapidiphilus]